MDSVKKLREPASWIVLVALALYAALGLAGLLLFPGPGAAEAASAVAYRVADPLMIIVLVGLVATCVLTDRTPHARLLTLISMIIVGVTVLLALVLAVVGVTAGGLTSILGFLTLLTVLALPIVGLGLLIKLWSEVSAGDPTAQPLALPQPSYPALPPPPDPQLQPTWQPDAAAGAVWRTAGEAASGAPASGWGAPGPDAGWQPIPTATGVPPYPPAEDVRRTDPNIR